MNRKGKISNNTSLSKQSENMTVCYQNSIENKIGYNLGHVTLAKWFPTFFVLRPFFSRSWGPQG